MADVSASATGSSSDENSDDHNVQVHLDNGPNEYNSYKGRGSKLRAVFTMNV